MSVPVTPEKKLLKKKRPKFLYPVALRKYVRYRLSLRAVLSIIVIAILVRNMFTANYENVFICALTLALFGIPILLDRMLSIDIPYGLEAVALLLIFGAEIMGEMSSFYTRFRYWDTLLHTTCGFLMAAFGFALVDIFNRTDRFTFKLSPLFLAVISFCFSMTIGVLWEFFEFFMDSVFNMDMQKDYIITKINSVKFNPDGLNVVGHVTVESLIVNGEDWMELYGGYIDIGIIDTMKDLFVNFIGAVVFSVVGFFYVRNRGEGKFARQFVPTLKRPAD